jgi:tetratricopeptide (TPR) repeat protein
MVGGLRRTAFDCIVAIGLFVTASVFAGSAIADDAQTCADASGDVAIAACTQSIESGQFTGHNLAIIYYTRGTAYNEKGDNDRAIVDYTEAITLNPKDANYYNNRCKAYNDKGANDPALVDCNEAIRLDPEYAPAYNNRGIAYRDKGDLDHAIADYTEAITLNPNDAFAHYNRGIAKRAKGDTAGGDADIAKAKQLDPSVGN